MNETFAWGEFRLLFDGEILLDFDSSARLFDDSDLLGLWDCEVRHGEDGSVDECSDGEVKLRVWRICALKAHYIYARRKEYKISRI